MKALLAVILLAGFSATVLAAERAAPATTPSPRLGIQVAPKQPDYVVEHASKVGGSDKEVMVKIKNAGSADAPSALVSAMNMAPGYGGSNTQGFSPIKAGSFVWAKLTLSKAPRPNDRILVRLDHNKAVAEKNETNNDYYFNW